MATDKTVQQYFNEIKELGLPDLNNTSLFTILNQAHRNVVTARRWPFRRDSETFTTASQAITDLGTVDYVYDATNLHRIPEMEAEEVHATRLDTTTTGAPLFWYRATSSTATISFFPVNNGASITVYYFKLPTVLTSLTENLLVPDEYAAAVIYEAAYLGNVRNGVLDLAREFKLIARDEIERMVEGLLRASVTGTTVPYPVGD